MNWDFFSHPFIFFDTQAIFFLPHINGAVSLSDYQGPIGLSCPHKRSEWQLELEYPPMYEKKSPLLPWNGTITLLQPHGAVLCTPSRGRYRRLPAVGWGQGLDMGPGWRQMQGGVDDPTRGLLRKGVWMVMGGLRLEGSGLLAAP